MEYAKRLGNVYAIDTRMFGFEYYMSAFLVRGKNLALVDTGVPTSFDTVCNAIKEYGFALEDITHIFITHEHPDHMGNAAKLLKVSPKANVYMNPAAEKRYLEWSDPEKTANDRFVERAGTIEPTPLSRIRLLQDGEIIDLGNGEALKVIFTPGHLPGALTLYDEKNNGLYINDLIGNYFPDAAAHIILLPMGSDIKQQISSMQKLIKLPVNTLYLGHYGIINENVKGLMQQTLHNMHQVLEIGVSCMKQNRPDLIREKLNELVEPYVEKMRRVRGEEVYQYITQLHVPFLLDSFTQYCKDML